MAGIARGKILPADKFIRGGQERSLAVPEAVFVQTVTGSYPDTDKVTNPANVDVYMMPDATSMRPVPWYEEPTAQVVCDCVYQDNRPVVFSPRQVLRRVLKLFEDRGWQPIIAPELEFYLVAINADPDYPLEPPVGRSGRPEKARQSYGIDAVNEFDPLFEELYDHCEAARIDIDTLSHESGPGQIEINFNHGDPLALADQVFLFKRTVRETALRHKVYATFMAKPMENEPGSAMHIHQSIVDRQSGRNLFATPDGNDSDLLFAFIGGLQRYLPAAMPFFAPHINSYRRLIPYSDAPINTHWARDNRTVGLRVPLSLPDARRVENRVPGADANPYLAIAATLACGYLGIAQSLYPTDPVEGSAYHLDQSLPRHLLDSLQRLDASESLHDIMGDKFLAAVNTVKEAEYDDYLRVISSWEREYLLLNV
jgi:glutamine synthetase